MEPLESAPLDLDDALSALDRIPLLARESARAQLLGARVRCRGRLGSLKAVSADRLKVGIIMRSDDVYFEVARHSYPWLLTATHGIPVQAEGTLTRFEIGVWLEEASIAIL